MDDRRRLRPLNPASLRADCWRRPARPKDVIEKLNQEVQRAVARPELQKRLVTVGMEPPPPYAPADFRKFIENDIVR